MWDNGKLGVSATAGLCAIFYLSFGGVAYATESSADAFSSAFLIGPSAAGSCASTPECLAATVALGGSNPDEVAQTQNALDGNEAQSTTADQAVAAARQQVGAIIGAQGRTQLARMGVVFAFNGTPVNYADLPDAQASFSGTGGGAAADSAGRDRRLGGFLNVKYSNGEQDGNSFEAGFDFDVIGVLGGVDYRFGDRLVAGLAFGYDRSDADFTAPATGTIDSNSYSFAAYVTYYPTDALYFDGLLSYSRNDIDSERSLIFPGFNGTATGETDGNRIAASANLGYQVTQQALTYGPYVQANYIYANVDGFTESGVGVLNLNIDDEEVRSFTSVLGVRADYNFSTSWGVITPTVRAEWEHEFSNDDRILVATFATNPGNLINVPTKKPDRDYFNVGVGVSGTFSGGVTAFADFEILLGHQDLDNFTTTVGVRLEF